VKRRPTRPRRKPAPSLLRAIKPLIPVVVKPVVETVVSRLERHEQLLEDLKAALAVQFQRIAAMQAQLDQLVATRTQPR
jgi:hypothetical protein